MVCAVLHVSSLTSMVARRNEYKTEDCVPTNPNSVRICDMYSAFITATC